MRKTWVIVQSTGLALLALLGCQTTPHRIKAPPLEEEFRLPPEDPRFSKPPQYPKELLNQDPNKRDGDNPKGLPPNMRNQGMSMGMGSGGQ